MKKSELKSIIKEVIEEDTTKWINMKDMGPNTHSISINKKTAPDEYKKTIISKSGISGKESKQILDDFVKENGLVSEKEYVWSKLNKIKSSGDSYKLRLKYLATPHDTYRVYTNQHGAGSGFMEDYILPNSEVDALLGYDVTEESSMNTRRIPDKDEEGNYTIYYTSELEDLDSSLAECLNIYKQFGRQKEINTIVKLLKEATNLNNQLWDKIK